MKILVVSSNYPSLQKPNYGAFVYNLMQELAKNHIITVVSPVKLHEVNKPKQATYGDEACCLKRPIYLSIGSSKIGFINVRKISSYFYIKAVQRVLQEIKEKPDIIYTHFIENAIPVLDYATDNNIPIVVASGESTYASFDSKSEQEKNKLIESIAHIVSVSIENKQQLIALGFKKEKITVIPNAVNYELFKPLDKDFCKQKLGLPLDKFTVGFIGHFIHRKGPNRIIQAIEKLNDENINLVCVGNRGELIKNSFTTILPPMPNEQLPIIYNAFDVFVLPTLHEGSCNVIEEAKACCIPIISSKGTSVEEQIDSSSGVLIDPLNIDALANEISKLKQDVVLRKNLIHNLNEKRGENSITQRATTISKILKDVALKINHFN